MLVAHEVHELHQQMLIQAVALAYGVVLESGGQHLQGAPHQGRIAGAQQVDEGRIAAQRYEICVRGAIGTHTCQARTIALVLEVRAAIIKGCTALCAVAFWMRERRYEILGINQYAFLMYV